LGGGQEVVVQEIADAAAHFEVIVLGEGPFELRCDLFERLVVLLYERGREGYMEDRGSGEGVHTLRMEMRCRASLSSRISIRGRAKGKVD
jgi:hypothetical protein